MKKVKIIMTIGAIALMGIGTVVGIATKGTEVGEVNDAEIENVAEIEISENDFRIRELRQNKILIGNEKGELNLDSTLKRQEMVVIISRLMGKEEEAKTWNTSNLTFEDVSKDNWAAGYIAWAKDNNITKGYSEEWFGYDDTLTEKQTGIFLLRVLGYNEVQMDTATEIAARIGIIGFYDELKDEEINRGKVALMIYNALYCNIKDSDQILNTKLGLFSEYEGAEREIAVFMSENGITYNTMTELNGWRIMYVDLKDKIIDKETVKEELSLYTLIGNYVDFNHYVLIDINTNKKIEVINYKEQGIIYQIKLDGKVIYEYSE